MALEVIGAGFGRTGTTSLKAALEQLGFSKCHHMAEVARSSRQIALWHRLGSGGAVDWDDVFEGFRASCDWPSCTHWEALAAHYPGAKILLTVRDESRWYDSVAETIYPASFVFPRWLLRLVPRLRRFHDMVVACVWDGEFDGRFEDRDHALRVYRAHVARVKERAASERLLVFDVKEGWEPLCRFLNVPVPEGPFPHLNDAKSIRRALRAVRAVGWLAALALLAGGVWLVL